MKKFEPTPEQQNAIVARGGVLVSAAAGSGKTAVLVERVAQMILDNENRVPADRLLIVTFTKAAAAEMRSRISQRLTFAIAQNPTNSWYISQKNSLNKASICTIDSFCINLVREYFYAAGFEPDFSMTSDKSMETIVFNELINEKLMNDDKDVLSLISLFGVEDGIDRLCDVVNDTHTYLDSLVDKNGYLLKCQQMYDDFDIKNSEWTTMVLAPYSENVKRLLNRFNAEKEQFEESEFFDLYKDVWNNRIDILERYDNALENKEWDKVVALSDVKLDTVKNYKDVDEDKKEYYKSLFKTVNEFKKNISSKIVGSEARIFESIKSVAPRIKTLFSFIMEYEQRLFEYKKKENCYTFADVEYAALKLLVNDDGSYTDIAKELSARFYEVMVDEYQDTNDLQNAIFTALSNNGDNMFCVGDVKQCIYGFRLANPKLFLNKKNTLPDFDKSNKDRQKCKVVMSGNFRSEKNICQAINFVFSRIMQEKIAQMQYTEDDYLMHNFERSKSDIGRVRLDIISVDRSEENANEFEHRHIVNLIRKSVDEIKLGEENRKVNYGDIAVICRKGKDVSAVSNVLKKFGIPAVCVKKNSFFDEREIIIALSLLRSINNPLNSYELLCVMMSELFSFTANDIATIKSSAKCEDLIQCVIKSDNEKAKAFLEELSKYRQMAVGASLKELLEGVFEESGLFDISRAVRGGYAVANLRKLISLADEYENMSQGGLSGFLRYIGRMIDNPRDRVDSAKYQAEEDAVKIMTVHHSKGLQFPICIYAGLGSSLKDGGANYSAMQCEKSGIGIKAVDEKLGCRYETLAFQAAKAESYKNQIAEEIRIMYVAMTRAQEYLFMTGTYKNIGKTPTYLSKLEKLSSEIECSGGAVSESAISLCKSALDLIVLASLTHTKCQNLRELANASASIISTDYMETDYAVNIINSNDINVEEISEIEDKLSADERAVADLSQRLSYVYPFSEVNKVAAKQSASRIAHENENADYSCSAVPMFIQNRKITPAQRGTAMHNFMQYLNIKDAVENFDDEIRRIKSLKLFSDDEWDSLDFVALKKFVLSDIAEQMINADSIYCEREFIVELPANQIDDKLGEEFIGENIVVQGAVDCVYITDRKMTIVDYKTDRVKSLDELKLKYAKQLQIYEKALMQIYDVDECELILYSFNLSSSITV